MTTPYAGNAAATFPANITTITDNDEPSGALFTTPLEQLADRTAILAAFAKCSITGGNTGNPSPMFLTKQVGGFSLNADSGGSTVTVPAPGDYIVTFSGSALCSTGGAYVSIMTRSGGGDVEHVRFPFLADANGQTAGFSMTAIVTITSTTTEKIFGRAQDAATNGITTLTIRRIY